MAVCSKENVTHVSYINIYQTQKKNKRITLCNTSKIWFSQTISQFLVEIDKRKIPRDTFFSARLDPQLKYNPAANKGAVNATAPERAKQHQQYATVALNTRSNLGSYFGAIYWSVNAHLAGFCFIFMWITKMFTTSRVPDASKMINRQGCSTCVIQSKHIIYQTIVRSFGENSRLHSIATGNHFFFNPINCWRISLCE